MLEIRGRNIWDFYPDHIVGVTTNGIVKSNGELVMGKGIALDAAKRVPNLALTLGKLVRDRGNQPFLIDNILSFPTKWDWRDKSDLTLIKNSAILSVELVAGKRVYLPRPGCGNGGLDWETVMSIIKDILPDNFTVVNKE